MSLEEFCPDPFSLEHIHPAGASGRAWSREPGVLLSGV